MWQLVIYQLYVLLFVCLVCTHCAHNLFYYTKATLMRRDFYFRDFHAFFKMRGCECLFIFMKLVPVLKKIVNLCSSAGLVNLFTITGHSCCGCGTLPARRNNNWFYPKILLLLVLDGPIVWGHFLQRRRLVCRNNFWVVSNWNPFYVRNSLKIVIWTFSPWIRQVLAPQRTANAKRMLRVRL